MWMCEGILSGPSLSSSSFSDSAAGTLSFWFSSNLGYLPKRYGWMYAYLVRCHLIRARQTCMGILACLARKTRHMQHGFAVGRPPASGAAVAA